MTDKPSDYTERELTAAKAAITKMTPEAYVDKERYVKKLEQDWPEAPASATMRVVYPSGYDIQWTLRDFDEDMLAIRVDRVLQSFGDMDCKPGGDARFASKPAPQSAGSANAPQAQRSASPEDLVITSPNLDRDTIDKAGYEMFPVETITHMVTQGKAVPHLVVKGGNFTKFGWKAWQEVWPDMNIDDFPIGKELSAPPSMRYAYLSKGEGGNRKVVAFLGDA
jgi:hypothetical protein